MPHAVAKKKKKRIITVRHYCIPIRRPTQKPTILSFGKDAVHPELSFVAGEGAVSHAPWKGLATAYSFRYVSPIKPGSPTSGPLLMRNESKYSYGLVLEYSQQIYLY